MAMLTFLGAARTVTGSKYLLEVDEERLLIDCGLFQGLRELRRRNWSAFPVDPATISAVLLTHAHIDHSGFLPRLVAAGFKGKIYCTAGTASLCSLVLPDAAHLQEEDARLANERGYSRWSPAEPLFTTADAEAALARLEVVNFDELLDVAPGLQAEFKHAGHLLGSAFIRVTRTNGGRRILFGGDLGRYGRPVLPDPEPAPEAETVLLESTYGNRIHPDADDEALLESVIEETRGRGGRVIIPSFAIGRAEELLYWIKRLEDRGRITAGAVYLDSPMAVDALRFYVDHERELDRDAQSHDGTPSAFATARFRAVSSPRESMEIVKSKHPAIIISASGMATGGRVLHHLASCLPDPRHTILFVGFQAEGTRGRALLDGAKSVKIHGAMVPVAARVHRIDSMSAHADQSEITRWLRTFTTAPEQMYLVHGEPAAQDALKAHIETTFGWKVHAPQHMERVEVSL
jgi:metallo-beta-lactamase family protein